MDGYPPPNSFDATSYSGKVFALALSEFKEVRHGLTAPVRRYGSSAYRKCRYCFAVRCRDGPQALLFLRS